MLGTLKDIKFLFVGPMIVVMLAVINWMTTPEYWWFKWAALGIGIGWAASLFRVLKAIFLLGGLAALFAYIENRKSQNSALVPPTQAD